MKRYCRGLFKGYQKGGFLSLKGIQRNRVNGPFILRCLILLHSWSFSYLAKFNKGNDKDCIATVEPRASLYEPEEDCKKIKTTLLVLSKISTEVKNEKCENLTHKEAEWA